MSDSNLNILVCALPQVPLRAEPNDRSEQVSQILAGELITEIPADKELKGNWIYVTSLDDGYKGYVDPRHFRPYVRNADFTRTILIPTVSTWKCGDKEVLLPAGAYIDSSFNMERLAGIEIIDVSDEVLNTQTSYSISEAAMAFLGAPYQWGGKTVHGIDCSGLTQISARLTGNSLLRDAFDQAVQGVKVEWGNRSVNDLAFFKNNEGKITHVGILMSRDKIIHASGEVRIDRLEERGIVHSESGELTHVFSHLSRL